jgi:hypothetical protein
MCGRLLEPRVPRIHLCFRCWFIVDQLAFRAESWQAGQIPLRFSLTRFAGSPEHTRRGRRKRVFIPPPQDEKPVLRRNRTAREQHVPAPLDLGGGQCVFSFDAAPVAVAP